MPDSRAFTEVTEIMVGRLKEFASTQYGMVFDPPEGDFTLATSRTPLGECVIHFAYDSRCAELTMTLRKKPMLLPDATVWSLFAEALARIRDEQ